MIHNLGFHRIVGSDCYLVSVVGCVLLNLNPTTNHALNMKGSTILNNFYAIEVQSPREGFCRELKIIMPYILCDCLIFAVKSDSTSVQSIKKALQYILYSNARLIGFVLNNKDFTKGDYGKKVYYSHYKKYGYRYSYNYGYGVDKIPTEN